MLATATATGAVAPAKQVMHPWQPGTLLYPLYPLYPVYPLYPLYRPIDLSSGDLVIW